MFWNYFKIYFFRKKVLQNILKEGRERKKWINEYILSDSIDILLIMYDIY